jgi:hypothetical protein
MTRNEKAGVAVAVIGVGLGAFALGWYLHKPKVQGNVTLDLKPNGPMWYKVLDSSGNEVVGQSFVEKNATLSPGNYTVDMYISVV